MATGRFDRHQCKTAIRVFADGELAMPFRPRPDRFLAPQLGDAFGHLFRFAEKAFDPQQREGDVDEPRTQADHAVLPITSAADAVAARMAAPSLPCGEASARIARCKRRHAPGDARCHGKGRPPPGGPPFASWFAECAYCGISTVSMTWITPFEASTSVAVTVAVPPAASVSTTLPSTTVAVSVPPLTVLIV